MPLLCLFFALLFPSLLGAASLSWSLFIQHPPYQCAAPYVLNLHSAIPPTIAEICSHGMTYSSAPLALHELPVATLPYNQTLLWIGHKNVSCALIQKLKENNNTINTLSSTTLQAMTEAYLSIQPDIVFLPWTLKHKLEMLTRHHPRQKPLVVIFYPSSSPSFNCVLSLSKSTFHKKRSAYPHLTSWVQALGYSHSSSIPTETFLLKKYFLTEQGRVLAKKEKPRTLKNLAALNLDENCKVIALGTDADALHLAMGGLIYELEKQKTPCSLLYTHAASYKKDLDALLDQPHKTLYVFMPQKLQHTLAKKIKSLLPKCSSLFVAYYATPWEEPWNLYHYCRKHGLRLHALIGLLKMHQDLSQLNALDVDSAECYYVTTLFSSH